MAGFQLPQVAVPCSYPFPFLPIIPFVFDGAFCPATSYALSGDIHPPDSPSPGTPLSLAISFPLTGGLGTFTNENVRSPGALKKHMELIVHVLASQNIKL